MNRKEARNVLKQMIEGFDPITGERFPERHVCNDVTVVRALYKAMCALDDQSAAYPSEERAQEQSERSCVNQTNNKKRWTPPEDDYLRDAHRRGTDYCEMSEELFRSVHNIKYRMVYLGLAPREVLGKYRTPSAGCENQGLPWYPEDDEKLTMMFRSGCSAKEMAKKLKRSVGGIASRLEKLGLIED